VLGTCLAPYGDVLRSTRTTGSLLLATLACAAVAGCDPVSEDAIGPEGGVVVSDDGRLTLEVPAGALDEAVDITIEEAEDLPEGALGPAYDVQPRGLVFGAPIRVVYNYSAQGTDVPAADVSLVVERTDEWVPLADRHVFEGDSIISASALYLSTFCVVEGR